MLVDCMLDDRRLSSERSDSAVRSQSINNPGRDVFVRACEYSSPPGLRRTTWHVSETSSSLSSSVDMETSQCTQQLQQLSIDIDNTEAQQLLTVAANRVWEELYVCKKPVSILYYLFISLNAATKM